MDIDVTINLGIWFWLLPVIAKGGVIKNVEDRCITYYYDNSIKTDCSNLNLNELPDNLSHDTQLFDLSNNNFRIFPDALQNFTRIQSLNFYGNGLRTSLPSFMGKWTELTTLNLSNNYYFNWLTTDQKYSIQLLDLSSNILIAIDDTAFNDMPHLTFLDLSNNLIMDLASDMFSGINLDTLVLTKNSFYSLPKLKSSSLTSLFISNCLIRYFPMEPLVDLNSILLLDVSMNYMDSIPDDLNSNTLQELNLSYNTISSLNVNSFSALPHLAVLDLRGNQFTTVWSTSYFSSNLFLREVYVYGNRWNCEGFGIDLLLTYEFLTKEPPKVSDTSSLTCFLPQNVTDLTWREAYIRTWHPLDSSASSFTYIGVMIGLIVGIFLTSVVCRCLSYSKEQPARPTPETTVLNSEPAAEATVMRIPLRDEDLPPSYDEALLMPRLDSSFHSLPDFVDVDIEENIRPRRSMSIGDLLEHRDRTRDRARDRRSVRRTVEIHINHRAT